MATIFINTKSYIVKDVIGKGSFGTVYKAQDQSNKKLVAIKMQQYISENELYLIRKLIGKEFKNLVNIFDFQIHQNQISIVMELGLNSLQNKIQQSKVSPKEARYVMKQIANGIHELHSLGIAHRDLKPENILIFTLEDQDKTQEVYKICDFGTTKDIQKMQTPCVGTPYYLAPEQLAQDSHFNQQVTYNQSVDIWAFGALMYELFTNSPLFNGKTIPEIHHQIKTLHIEQEIRKLNNLEDKYKELLIKMLQRDPNKRITIENIKKELTEITRQNQQQTVIQRSNMPVILINQSAFQRESIRYPNGFRNQPSINQSQSRFPNSKQIEFQKITQPGILQNPFQQNNRQINLNQSIQQQTLIKNDDYVRGRDQQRSIRQMYFSPQLK
ncbi:unnamed protein product (macronuclear) [Paramecium tetraurelia]|uniref:Protein kinase domain-containing protein n=1 Tax=Paramecium tetraurelia TaxID=5888 RepID=A0DYW3_PARTE|nr:uncharacterized protein GSPATT00003198001 [Paramecium tetraurelia]CAK88230.1 unnamed protein product [Paramecium tetraurelia]|eukprot:XP_001455627.1 hypothetical protein (macronuclear) [Paramecium tetraurelia strain d4-2]